MHICREEKREMVSAKGLMRCLKCDELIRGRIDKKFCNDSCRNSYNNERKAGEEKAVRMINGILQKNRRILKALYEARKFRVKKATLSQLGFSRDYHTHRVLQPGGKPGLGYYDHAITPAGKDSYRIVSLPVQFLPRNV